MTLQAWRDRALLVGPFSVALLLALVSPGDDGPTFCPFALITGMACPGCGMTRAASRLFHGDIGAALTFHPLVPIVLLEAVGAWVWFMLRRSGRVEPMRNRTLNVIMIATAISLVAVWVLRMTTGSLPSV